MSLTCLVRPGRGKVPPRRSDLVTGYAGTLTEDSMDVSEKTETGRWKSLVERDTEREREKWRNREKGWRKMKTRLLQRLS